ncbi:hypothetical protein AB0H36_27570 [Kribbella sp. NPDC050820]|uniref:hypothetical protein n=1 Tax=Kribbella sp. NPDC050820 TaxID=3155408 RepID=UPI0033CBE7CD
MPDSPDSDPLEVLDYLRRYSGSDIPLWVRRADVCDALTLNTWLWWEDRRRELHFLRAGVECGLHLAEIGSQIGIGKQGVRDRIDRLEALLRYDRPDEKIMRRERRLEQEAGEGTSPELAWLAARRDVIVAVIVALIEQAEHYALAEDDREWIDELAVDIGEERLTPATMVMLGLAAAELRTAEPVLALSSQRPFTVHEVLRRADAVRSDFAALAQERH